MKLSPGKFNIKEFMQKDFVLDYDSQDDGQPPIASRLRPAESGLVRARLPIAYCLLLYLKLNCIIKN